MMIDHITLTFHARKVPDTNSVVWDFPVRIKVECQVGCPLGKFDSLNFLEAQAFLTEHVTSDEHRRRIDE